MRRSLKLLAALPVVFLFLGSAQNVFAHSVTFDFSFSGTGVSGMGSLTATLVSGNEYLVTSISGMQNGTAMTLLAPGAFAGNDNEIFSSKPYLNLSGLGFASGSIDYNLYYNPSTAAYLECSSLSPCTNGSGVAITVGYLREVTPEPGTMLLLGSGLIGLAGMARRKLVS